MQQQEDRGEMSDGYHTFNELYEHRNLLFCALCQAYKSLAWKSALHDDGTMFEDSFVAGLRLPTGDITYHLPTRMKSYMHGIKILERAPKWDGHTSKDVIERLKAFCPKPDVEWVCPGIR